MKKAHLILLTVFSSACFAQSFEATVSGGVSRFSNKDIGGGYSLDDGFRLAFRLGFTPHPFLGAETGYAYNRTQLSIGGQQQGMAVHQGFGNVLAHATREGSRVRPFVTGGLNFSNFVPPGQTAQWGQGNTKFGVNYGGGVKFRVAERWQVRFDVRQFNTGVPFGLRTGRMLQNEFSVGVGYVLP